MKHTEIEVKFHLPDADSMRQKIIALGAKSSGRIFESNIRFEDRSKSLVKRKSLLRLRQDARSLLTFKRPPPQNEREYKVFEEFETEVADFDATCLILEAIGFYPEQVYEKWRETLTVQDTLLCLDSLPFGDFLEIEGTKESIRELAMRIGLAWKNRILLTYLQLFEHIRQDKNLSFMDVSFANFKSVRVDPRFFTALTAGRADAF